MLEATSTRVLQSPVQSPGSLANLADLRSQLVNHLACLLMGASGLAMWLALPRNPFPLVPFAVFAALLGLGVGVRLLVDQRPVLARHVLVWGLNAALLISMLLFSGPWLPFFGLLLILVGALLISGSELATAGLVAGLSGWLAWHGGPAYPLPAVWMALAVGVVVAWLTVHSLYTTLRWTMSMQERTDRLLEEVRDHRGQLSRALKSTEIANALLQRTQRELIVARRRADEARRMKERFAANISHELRTPLNLVLGFSEMMHLSPEVYGDVNWPPTLCRDIYQIYRSSRHLMGLIDDILDLSRFEIPEFTLNKEATPLAPLLEDTGAIAADLFRGHPARFEVDVPSDLPTLEIDRTRIRQVLLNLLSNARRFTAEGLVRLSARQQDGEVIISISDTGPGIPPDKLPHVFDEFYQVDLSLHRSHQGAGLGLAISKRFVQAHGGSIWMESQEGQGTTAFFSLPARSSYLYTPPAYGSAEPELQWAMRAPDCILVVDPDPAVPALLRRRLEKYEIVQVKEAGRLSEAVARHHPHAVVYNVPPQPAPDDGGMFPVPLIECSLPSQAWLADDLHVVACLTKPITGQQLLNEIERLGEVKNILVVDDDRGFAQLVQRILDAAGRGYQVRRAYDGEESLAAMRAYPPDLVLLDLIMPGVDGFQVLEHMRAEATLADLPVILLTATSFAEDVVSRRGHQLVVRHLGGLSSRDVLGCLAAVFEVLEPRYDERSLVSEGEPGA
jgi:signal transduction histidine kinase/CheY-like chemotaxis protein